MAKNRRRWWWLAGPAVIACSTAAGLVSPDSSLTVLLIVATVCWVVGTVAWGLWRIWRWLTYRVAVKLFLSYLGVTPFVACGVFGLVALYMLMGQYTSVQFGHRIDRLAEALQTQGRIFLHNATNDSPEQALQSFGELAADGLAPFDHLVWVALLGDVTHRASDSPIFRMPVWALEEQKVAVVQHEREPYLLVAVRDSTSANAVVMMGPLSPETAANIGREEWYQVAFLDNSTDDPDLNLQLTADDEGAQVHLAGREHTNGPDRLWGRWQGAVDGLLDKPWIVWFKVPREGIRDLETGTLQPKPLLIMLLRTTPANVWSNFTMSTYEIADEIDGALIAVAVFFLVVYSSAVLISGGMILSITRATTRLTRGARAVGQGELGHRVPVRRHDQLGELADGFNRMAASVQDMLEEVKEKERLAQEMELARQIQESLLPESSQLHGAFAVHATFHPAAEVGGDAIDVFGPGEGRLQVMIADVAGHGLSTGLLMASLKTMVATLLGEGYSGRDLVQRVNRGMLEQQRRRTMATLAIIDAHAGRKRLHLTNAGHPPPFLIDPEGEMHELLAGSLPLGTKLCRPTTLDRAFLPGARVVLYSDGLVEADNPQGELFGFDRLASLLMDHRNLTSAELLAVVVAEWKAWIAGRPARDDVTVVILEALREPHGE